MVRASVMASIYHIIIIIVISNSGCISAIVIALAIVNCMAVAVVVAIIVISHYRANIVKRIANIVSHNR